MSWSKCKQDKSGRSGGYILSSVDQALTMTITVREWWIVRKTADFSGEELRYRLESERISAFQKVTWIAEIFTLGGLTNTTICRNKKLACVQ
jgi:hypothetical protein